MAQKTITYFYDCLSPFSFLAFQTFRRYEKVWDVKLVLKPMLLGIVMVSTGNTPPGARPWAKYTAKVGGQDMARNRKWFNIPDMKSSPSNFFGPNGPADKSGLSRDFRYMRMLAAVEMKAPDALGDATEGVFRMIYTDERDAEGRALVTEERLQAICERAGISTAAAKDIVDSINSPPVKDHLKANIAEAVEKGAYGSPFYTCDDQIYFGSDRLEQFAFTHGFPWYGPDPTRPTVAKM